MKSPPVLNTSLAALAPFIVAISATAQPCEPAWSDAFHGPRINNTIFAFAVHDDASGLGLALYAGGAFTNSAGGVSNRIARWNGSSWSPLGSGMNSYVYALAVFDDGSGTGPALYAGGSFLLAGGVDAMGIASWDGASWSAVGGGMVGYVYALAVYDDGTGPALYAGGYLLAAGGVGVSGIAKWDGQSWSPVGGGVTGQIYALTVFDDGMGSGPALFAGGDFANAGGVAANNIAKWDGSRWSPLGDGVEYRVNALAVFDEGSGDGAALFVGGAFSSAGGVSANNLAKWDGQSWTPLGDGVSDCIGSGCVPDVRALAVFDDASGDGPALYAGGYFVTAGRTSANYIAKWNGRAWSPVAGGMNSLVSALAAFDAGSGPALYAGGYFVTAGQVAAHQVARWDGSAWSSAGSVSGGMDSAVLAFATFDDGSPEGAALYAGGFFQTAGTIPANFIAKWNGSGWSPLGAGIYPSFLGVSVTALAVFDDQSGSGPALYAGGTFLVAGGVEANRIAKWDGRVWSPLDTGMNSGVFSLAVFDDESGSGPALYAGGLFITAGGLPALRIARWDGDQWAPVGDGLDHNVFAMTVFDDGSGPALYVGGVFGTAGSVAASAIAKWDGTNWSGVGRGVSDCVGSNCTPMVLDLAVFDDGEGGGPALYAAGNFTSAGANAANFVARWDGVSWCPLGSGTSIGASALAVFDDGTGGGPALYAGGGFASVGGLDANGIAKWNGDSWSPLGDGAGLGGLSPSYIYVLGVYDRPSGGDRALWAGGHFTTAGGLSSQHIAKWVSRPPPIAADVNADGVVNVLDLIDLLLCFEQPAVPGCVAEDINGDGTVNRLDLIDLLLAFGAGCP